jgi:nucleoid-associated protein YgaU/thioredoxin-like negative regulator of GroEL
VRPLRATAAVLLAGLTLAGTASPVAADRWGLVQRLAYADPADRPEAAADWLAAGHAAREAGDLRRAVEAYAEAGDGPDALFWLGTVQRWVGDLDAAAATFARLLAAHPDHADGLLGDARVALRTGDLPRAEADLTRLLAVAPDYPEAGDLLVTTYLRAGKRREAYDLVEAAYTGDDRLRRRADIAFQLAWYGRAARAYEDLRERHPDDPDLAVALGRTYERMGYLDRAVGVYADALRAHPEHVGLRIRNATVHRWLGEHAIAERQYDAVLTADPDAPDALLGRAYLELDRDHLSGVGHTSVLIVEPEVPKSGAPAPEAAPEPAPEPAVAPAPPAAAAPVPAFREVVHVVREGESLSLLARRYLGDLQRWPEIHAANPAIADPDRIHPGQEVVIRVPAPGAVLLHHTVHRDETLGTIARDHLGDAAAWRAVWRANPQVADPDRIEVGQILDVPMPVPVPAVGTSGAGTVVDHTVRRGETLGTIARDHLGDAARWRAVWGANPNLADPDRIFPGEVLSVPKLTPWIPPPPAVAEAPALPPPAPVPAPAPEPAPAAEPHPPRYRVTRVGWGAAQWTRQYLAAAPGSREGRRLMGRIELRRMAYPAAYHRFRDLQREDPADCTVCRDLGIAREGLMPVLDAFYRYDTARDLDGRADPTISGGGTPVRYRTVTWGLGGRDRVGEHLTLGARYEMQDTALTDLTTNVPVYDFDARTGWLEATVHLGDRHTVRAGVGATDYSPNDGSSIADKRYARLRLAWDRTRWDREWHLAATQGPYLGRSIPPQLAYSLFRERRLAGSAERRLTPRTRVYARAAWVDFDDGHTLGQGAVGARLRLGTHHVEAEYAQDHTPARFLDETAAGLRLAFIRTREARLTDRVASPFPFRLEATVRARAYEANTITVGGTPQASPSNRETFAYGEAAYAHPALAPLSFGAAYTYVHFEDNAFAYDTVNARGPTLFVALADPDGAPWRYDLTYAWELRWDEDPANDHFFRHRIDASLRYDRGAALAAGVAGRYTKATSFGEESLRLTADLTWRF